VKLSDNDIKGQFKIFEYRLSKGCFIQESEECRILSYDSGVTRVLDTFGKAVGSFELNRGLRGFLRVNQELDENGIPTPNWKVEYVNTIFDGLGDGNLYWSKDKGYEESQRNMWGANWGPGFYGW
jgi:hypothetical protein